MNSSTSSGASSTRHATPMEVTGSPTITFADAIPSVAAIAATCNDESLLAQSSAHYRQPTSSLCLSIRSLPPRQVGVFVNIAGEPVYLRPANTTGFRALSCLVTGRYGSVGLGSGCRLA